MRAKDGMIIRASRTKIRLCQNFSLNLHGRLLIFAFFAFFYFAFLLAFFFTLDDWLEVSIRKVLRPAISTQVFLGFSVPKKANAEMVPQIPSCHYMLLM